MDEIVGIRARRRAHRRKTLKGTKTFKKLDQKLDEFYRLSIFTAEEMLDYQAHRERLKDLAIAINKNLGVYYESFEHEIEVYIVPWTAKGFEDEALKKSRTTVSWATYARSTV